MYRIWPLKVGSVVEPEPRIFYLGDCDKTVALGNFCFLIERERTSLDKFRMLVDTGVAKVDGDRFNPSMTQSPDEEPLAQLSRHGVDPNCIETVVATHLHWDHVSPTILQMPNAKLYVDPREIQMVTNPPHPWFGNFMYNEVIEQLIRDGRVVETRDGEEVAPGIRVMSTPGHTFGGQSVVVETASGKAVITGDVCFTYRNLDEDLPGGFNCNLLECFNSLQKIRETADIALPGHDLRMLELYPGGAA